MGRRWVVAPVQRLASSLVFFHASHFSGRFNYPEAVDSAEVSEASPLLPAAKLPNGKNHQRPKQDVVPPRDDGAPCEEDGAPLRPPPHALPARPAVVVCMGNATGALEHGRVGQPPGLDRACTQCRFLLARLSVDQERPRPPRLLSVLNLRRTAVSHLPFCTAPPAPSLLPLHPASNPSGPVCRSFLLTLCAALASRFSILNSEQIPSRIPQPAVNQSTKAVGQLCRAFLPRFLLLLSATLPSSQSPPRDR